MEITTALKLEIKQLLIENLMLQITAEEIGDEQPLFGPGSIGLDSVDALQLVVALDKTIRPENPGPGSCKADSAKRPHHCRGRCPALRQSRRGEVSG